MTAYEIPTGPAELHRALKRIRHDVEHRKWGHVVLHVDMRVLDELIAECEYQFSSEDEEL